MVDSPAGFLNDIIEQLWPNINVAGCRMVKEIVEPMFATMLPGPLASLKFVKLDLGNVPIRVSKVDVHKTDNAGIKLDMDVTWDGQSDIDLDGKMVPKLVRIYHKDSNAGLVMTDMKPGNRAYFAKRKAVHIVVPSDECHPAGMIT